MKSYLDLSIEPSRASFEGERLGGMMKESCWNEKIKKMEGGSALDVAKNSRGEGWNFMT